MPTTARTNPLCVLYTTALFEEWSMNNRTKGSTHQSYFLKVPSRNRAIVNDISAGVSQKIGLPIP